MDEDGLLRSLRRALAADPGDALLRLHVAELLASRGRHAEAVAEAAIVLQTDPLNASALALVLQSAQASTGDDGQRPAPASNEQFDWNQAETELGCVVPSSFVEGGEAGGDVHDVEIPDVTLADVAGMTHVKERLESAFLAPIRHPALRKAFAKSLRGGLLLYGPPGCGKTFIARALAGELKTHFIPVRLHEVLDMWMGASERNLHDVFEAARSQAPCVLFLDEVDAIGQKRSQLRHSSMRSLVNQLLSELDDVAARNEGVFVLAATNTPWDVDAALRRPGRLDRTLLVLPPDADARMGILRHHLLGRPVGGVDLEKLAAMSEDYSGADLAHVCETASERALIASAGTGQVRLIGMEDLESALREVRPSTRAWFESARAVALFANEDGQWDELLRYLKRRKLA